MRRMVPALVLMTAVGVAACGDDEGGSSTSGTTSSTTSTTDTDGTGGGGTGTGGAPGTGGSTGNGGGGTGGAPGTGGGSAACADGGPNYLMECAADVDCGGCGPCFTFNNGGMRCTLDCQADVDCPRPSSGCSNMGVCKQN